MYVFIYIIYSLLSSQGLKVDYTECVCTTFKRRHLITNALGFQKSGTTERTEERHKYSHDTLSGTGIA